MPTTRPCCPGTGRHFLAGQIHAARQLAWCFAPYVNSYRRYVSGSWAPTAAVWGEDNRTCGFRVVGHGPGRRIECRIPGADVNPYIALAAAIAGGLYGIDHQLEPDEPYAHNAYAADDVPRIPTTLVEAIGELETSVVAAEAFGDDVHHHLVNTARQEWAARQPRRHRLGARPELRADLTLIFQPQLPLVHLSTEEANGAVRAQ